MRQDGEGFAANHVEILKYFEVVGADCLHLLKHIIKSFI